MKGHFHFQPLSKKVGRGQIAPPPTSHYYDTTLSSHLRLGKYPTMRIIAHFLKWKKYTYNVYFQMRRSHIFFATLYKQSNGLINLAFLGLILLILEVFAHFTDLSILLVFFISKSAISRILVMHSSPTIVWMESVYLACSLCYDR